MVTILLGLVLESLGIQIGEVHGLENIGKWLLVNKK